MLKSLKMAGLAVAVTLGALTSVSAPAAAQSSLEIIIGPDGARLRARDYCERNPWYDGCRDYRRRYGDDRRDGYDDGGGRGIYGDDEGFRRDYRRDGRRAERSCSADEALDKARRMGVRRARIVGIGERTIRVAGRSEGRAVMVRFGRRGNCPVL